KYLDGHAVSLGGMIVDGGRFDWRASGKFPGLTEPDPSYHGTVYADAFGPAAFIVKARVQLMRDLGAAPSPMNAFLLNLGTETLHLRMERHCRNAEAVAAFLERHPDVTWVNYPGLPASKDAALVKKYLPRGTCGVIAFGIKGGRAAAVRFMDSLKLAAIVVHVADARTGVLHPASTTHRQLTDAQLAAAGIGPDLVRLSVGIEDAADIIADLDQALAARGE
ncbi:MAG TPA: PLP-dependent transferase, partial [Kiritimatiellia bacterium]|nr:PLP-dependent transferase [Kiritimatiellia bacterium]